MTCDWCSKPSEGIRHSECNRKRKAAEVKRGNELMAEAHEAIAAIKAGGTAHVSAECMAEYGQYIAKQRELAQGKRGGRNTSNV